MGGRIIEAPQAVHGAAIRTSFGPVGATVRSLEIGDKIVGCRISQAIHYQDILKKMGRQGRRRVLNRLFVVERIA